MDLKIIKIKLIQIKKDKENKENKIKERKENQFLDPGFTISYPSVKSLYLGVFYPSFKNALA